MRGDHDVIAAPRRASGPARRDGDAERDEDGADVAQAREHAVELRLVDDRDGHRGGAVVVANCLTNGHRA